MDKEKIEGTVERVVFRSNNADGYSVIAIRDKDGTEHTIVGSMPNVTEGEQICCRGRWIQHEKYGRQFRVEELEVELPFTEEGVISYLTALGVKGLGIKTAAKIVQHFGVGVFDVLDQRPEALDQLRSKGVSQKVIDNLRQVWRDNTRMKTAVAFFRSHGIGMGTAVRILKEFPNAAVLAQENPYVLTKLKGVRVGFKTADKMARHLGWAPHAPERIQAGVIHILQENLDSGHTVMMAKNLLSAVVELLGVPRQSIVKEIKQMIEAKELDRLEIEGTTCLALPMVRATERKVVDLLCRIRRRCIQQQASPLFANASSGTIEKAIAQAEAKTGIRLEKEQRNAVHLALTEKALVITGGPGVGKTTITKVILAAIKKPGVKVALCAPTGKAAKRMSEATGLEAKTIHRLLEFNGETYTFNRNESSPLDADVVIVDEASMIDVFLAKDLLSAIPKHAKLIILGDKDQLPSVGPGEVLANIIRTGILPVVFLNKIHRQSADSAIIRTAHRINRHQLPEKSSANDFRFFKTASTEETYEMVQVLVQAMLRLLEKQGLPQEVQILTPMRRGKVGVASLNEAVKRILNPNPPNSVTIQKGKAPVCFSVGDRVIQTVNCYPKEVFNGTTGTIIDIDSKHVIVHFDGRYVPYKRDELRMLDLAYAISIHKSQGSEYSGVIIPVDPSQIFMLNKKLLYTGITRARHLCFMCGDPRTLAVSIKKRVDDRRLTAFPVLFQENQLLEHLVSSRRASGQTNSQKLEAGAPRRGVRDGQKIIRFCR